MKKLIKANRKHMATTFHTFLVSSLPTFDSSRHSQSTFTCSKLAIETLEQRVKYVQS